MAGREAPLRAQVPKQAAEARAPRGSQAPAQAGRCLGAAAQLATVHRTLRHGPAFQLQPGGATADAGPAAAPKAADANRTGLPDRLKAGVEALSGISLDGVKVHYNSSKPAQLNALAYAQGSDIHLAPGQEQHLPHEAWHVVQQAQGRVKPTLQMKGVAINADDGLEREADLMGTRAADTSPGASFVASNRTGTSNVVQGKFGFELEMRVLVSRRGAVIQPPPANADDKEESRYVDPGIYYLHQGTAEDPFSVVVDHGHGIAEYIEGAGHSRRPNTAIVEIVTGAMDEHIVTEETAIQPMVKAAAFAAEIEERTQKFNQRAKFNFGPVSFDDIYVGQRVLEHEKVWQTTAAQIQATYAVRIGQIHVLAGHLANPQGPLEANQFQAAQNQSQALSEGAAKAAAIVTLLARKIKRANAPNAPDLTDLKGLLTLVGSYLAGGRLDQSGGLDKNIVPLLLRHEMSAAFAELSPTTQEMLKNPEHRGKIKEWLLTLHQRGADELLFPGKEGAARRAKSPDTDIRQPTCDDFLEATLQGVYQALQGWFGKSKRIEPEPVGPLLELGEEPKGMVMEQRSLKTGVDTVDGVPPSEWPNLARRYYRMLFDLNK